MSNIPAQLSTLARSVIGKCYRHSLQTSASAQIAAPVCHSALQTRSAAPVAVSSGPDAASTSHICCERATDEQRQLKDMPLSHQLRSHSAGHASVANLSTDVASGVTHITGQLRTSSSDSKRQMLSSQMHAIPQHARQISSTAIYYRAPDASQGMPNQKAAPTSTKASFSRQMYRQPPVQNRDELAWDEPDAQSSWQEPPSQPQRPPFQRSTPYFARQPGESRVCTTCSQVSKLCCFI